MKPQSAFADINGTITGIQKTTSTLDAANLVWITTLSPKLICLGITENEATLIAHYSTLTFGMLSMKECPHDMNKYVLI